MLLAEGEALPLEGGTLLLLGGALIAGVLLVVIGLVLATRSGALRIGARRFEGADDLAAEVGLSAIGGLGLGSLRRVRLAGPLTSGRRANVRFVRDGDRDRARLGVFTDKAPRFAFASASSLPTEGGPGPLHAAEVREALGATFAHFGVARVELARGELVAYADLDALDPAHYRALLLVLDTVAAAFDRAPLDVDVLDGPRPALVRPGSEGARCASCQGGITGEEADLTACGSCGTVVHGRCWSGCAIPGCGGKSAERPAPRSG